MKLTYKDILVKHAGLMNVGKKVLPRKATVAIKRNVLKLEEEIKVMDDQRKDIINRYACLDEEGNPIVENDKYTFRNEEDSKAFLQELKELEETEVDLNLMKFDGSELDKCESSNRYAILTPVEEASIDWMISD